MQPRQSPPGSGNSRPGGSSGTVSHRATPVQKPKPSYTGSLEQKSPETSRRPSTSTRHSSGASSSHLEVGRGSHGPAQDKRSELFKGENSIMGTETPPEQVLE